MMPLTIANGLTMSSVMVLIGLLYIGAFLARVIRRSGGVKDNKQRTHVITFANHKGGVGKTTQIFFLSKYLALENPMVDILLIDGSIYRDLTRLFLGSSKAKDVPTINDLLANHRKKKALQDMSAQVNTLVTHQQTPDNLYLLSNTSELKNKASTYQVKQMRSFLQSIPSPGRDLIVLCDTDGGMMHNLTCLSIAIADSIIVPLQVDDQSVRRITTLTGYIDQLHTKHGMDWMKIKMYIYNNLAVSNNVPNDRCKAANLPFKISNGTLDQVEKITYYLKSLGSKYKGIDVGCSYGVRNGGTGLQQAKSFGSPFILDSTCGIDTDFRMCAKQITETCLATPPQPP